MATFRASRRLHLSENGDKPWALFELVAGSDPAVYELDTSDPEVIGRLDSVDDVTRVDVPVAEPVAEPIVEPAPVAEPERRRPGRPRKVATTTPAQPEAVPE